MRLVACVGYLLYVNRNEAHQYSHNMLIPIEQYTIQKNVLSSGVTITFSVAGPTATVSAPTLHLYALNGLIRAVILALLAVDEILVSWTLLFNAMLTVYIRTMPFW